MLISILAVILIRLSRSESLHGLQRSRTIATRPTHPTLSNLALTPFSPGAARELGLHLVDGAPDVTINNRQKNYIRLNGAIRV